MYRKKKEEPVEEMEINVLRSSLKDFFKQKMGRGAVKGKG